MKNEATNEQKITLQEPIIIPDECGDSMWDAVLDQEDKASQRREAVNELKALFNRNKNVQECDATEAK